MKSIADLLEPLIENRLGPHRAVGFRFWDGSALGPLDSSALIVRSPNAFRRLIYAPGELGLARAYVAGDLDVDGDIFEVLHQLRDLIRTRSKRNPIRSGDLVDFVRGAVSVGAFGRPLPPPLEEVSLRGRLHSKKRDEAAISHHYDLSNDFYRLVLGESMTYSCAYFASPGLSLDDAQAAKHDLVCRKLELKPGMRLLDVGCGWGGMLLHAVKNYGVEAVGITISRNQAELAEKRVAEEGLAGKIEIRLQDYRDLKDGSYDAISSVGMFEHVGLKYLDEYFKRIFTLLSRRGRFLNHAISRNSPGRAPFKRWSFLRRYVFPDGELHRVGSVVSAMQAAGFNIAHAESLGDHYGPTLRAWGANLERAWDEAVAEVGQARARIWRLYMAGSALGFERGIVGVHQVLGVKPSS